MIVCWEHNWPDVPKGLQVIELRREFGLGFNVWIQPVGGIYRDVLSETNYNSQWSVPSLAHKNDLILYYHTRPDRCIKDIFQLADSVTYIKAGWKPGKDYMGPIRRVCGLKAPIFLEDLKVHRILKTSGFVRGNMQGRPNATEYWPHLYDMIVRRNPEARRGLKKFAPDQLG
jgi:hypothetical protein